MSGAVWPQGILRLLPHHHYHCHHLQILLHLHTGVQGRRAVTVLAILLPVVKGKRRANQRPWRLFRWSESFWGNRCSFSFLVLPPHVLFQPLFRGTQVITLVTWKHSWSLLGCSIILDIPDERICCFLNSWIPFFAWAFFLQLQRIFLGMASPNLGVPWTSEEAKRSFVELNPQWTSIWKEVQGGNHLKYSQQSNIMILRRLMMMMMKWTLRNIIHLNSLARRKLCEISSAIYPHIEMREHKFDIFTRFNMPPPLEVLQSKI